MFITIFFFWPKVCFHTKTQYIFPCHHHWLLVFWQGGINIKPWQTNSSSPLHNHKLNNVKLYNNRSQGISLKIFRVSLTLRMSIFEIFYCNCSTKRHCSLLIKLVLSHKGSHPAPIVQFFLTLFKRPLTPPPSLVLNMYDANFFERLLKKCVNACHDKIRQNNA